MFALEASQNTIENIVVNESAVIYQFKKTPIVNKLILGAEGEDLEISFETLVDIINQSVNLEEKKLSIAN